MEENRKDKENVSLPQTDIKEPEKDSDNNLDFKKPIPSLTRAKALIVKNKSEEYIEKKPEEQIQNTFPPDEVDELESDEEKDIPAQEPLSKEENYCLKNILVPKYSLKELNETQLEKIYNLKEATEEAIAKTVKNKQSSNIVKALVSKKKYRFCYDGFDLDLSYITTRIIAMGLPSTSIEGLYRNPMEEVQKFFNTRHPSHYKVYNLCEEKNYPQNTFFKQGYFPFKDHEAPPLNLMRPFCEDAKQFLDEDENNIIAVHCKAGKGRTGTLICCLLMYMNIFDNFDECLQYYGMMRVENGKGVTIPSQIRYVKYFETILKNNMAHPISFVKKCITKIKMFTLPMYLKTYIPSFTIENNGKKYNFDKKNAKVEGSDFDAIADFNIEKGFNVEGDVYIVFNRIHVLGKKEKIFKFWFNTNFVPENNIYEFKKKYLDKACKDKKNKYFKPGFKVEVHFS